MNAMMSSALLQYKQVSTASVVADASPHQLIQILMAGALEKIAVAKGNIERSETAEKGRNTGAAISILDGLRTTLDMEKGGEIAQNLEALYDYMMRRLVEANCRNDTAKLDEVTSLLSSLKSAWDAIPPTYRNLSAGASA